MTERIQNAGTEVVEAKAGAVSINTWGLELVLLMIGHANNNPINYSIFPRVSHYDF